MSQLHRLRIFGIVLTAIVAIALVALGFGHRLPTASDAAVDAFMLAGGDLSDLCGDGTQGSAHRDCPACHITSASLLPDPAETVRDAELRLLVEVIAPRQSRIVHAVRDPVRGMGAPPLA